MNPVLFRYHASAAATNGWLAIDALHFAHILERPIRLPDGTVNVRDLCAYPAGIYPLVNKWSETHGKVMPHITGVPGRDDLELHCGSHVSDSAGCSLMGIKQVSEAEIVSGLGAGLTDQLTDMINKAGGPVQLQVINGPQVAAFLGNGVV